ncbi:armadillo repeat protein deleted in velo-cardio-facial syndrome-like isoform X3 [Limulus polyphemus]|uniref:Armadillo repeat protein deleted in velo-cardio-facial syndrome-like isoform X3 n=1 Tax=Limulus polyphemus TaxID=6850 RepID=A0ABM1SKM5_LIMPO|nr:armadillo repeat protein deleted in velo-cardio-facial syndrome-like isoform X3 [Limulus polyphemus]
MPSGDSAAHNRPLVFCDYQAVPATSPFDVIESVKQEYRRRDREHEEGGNISSYVSAEDPYNWRPSPLEPVIPENPKPDPKMTDSHLRYYHNNNADYRHFIQEGPPQVDSYSVSYQTSSTNGPHGDDGSLNSSQMSAPGDNATLVSRSMSQTKTQQVKTVTKVIATREVRHIGPDGRPIEYPPSGTEYVPFHYGNPADGSQDYGTYDSGRPPSPAGQAPTHAGYPGDYAMYGRAPSLDSGRVYELCPPGDGQSYQEYDYRDYPPQPPSPPSAASESPPPRRAMPQAPHGGPIDFNHHPSGYEELDTTVGLPRSNFQDRYGNTPSPAPPGDRYGPYGYPGPQIPVTSPGYNPYELGPPPQGYLDKRPSYDDHPQGHPTPYYPAPTAVLEDDVRLETLPEGQLLPPPRHPHLDYDPVETEGRDVRWRDPDLHEVIDFLGHPNNVVRANAAAYLQHLCYMDDNMKQKTRALGGIPPLIELLNQEIPEIQRNSCGALRNLSYGRQNDENKRAIRNAGGIPALVRLLRKTPDNEIRELVTGILWNLSSCEDLKRPIIDDALCVLVSHVIFPHAGWDRNRDNSESVRPQEVYWSTVFRNASGILRNVSSAGEYARKKLRECEGLVDSLLHLVKAAIGKNDMDNKSVENCVCVFRNLSYRCQEVEDPDYDKHVFQPSQPKGSPMKVGDNLGCFGASKKKKEAQNLEKQKKELMATNMPRPNSQPARGMELLWQPEIVHSYLSLLSECSNPETLEAAAGSIQNLAACYWQPSIDIRAAVRKEKGLPILVELLRMEVDRVVCAVATALRNLAMDQRNKELIGKYAMRDLVQKLPNSSSAHDAGTSNETVAAVLATLNEVIVKNSDFARSLLEAGGVERLTYITKQRGKFSPRVVKFTAQLLYNMWQHQELREVYRRSGWKETHFITRTMVARSSASPTGSTNSTLSRPISTQGGTKYEDRTLPRGGQVGVYNQAEEYPMNDLAHPIELPHHRPPVGGVPIYPPAPMRSPVEPLYAQVNRDKKKNRHPDSSSQSMLLDHQGAPAGDSWV